MAGDRQCSAGRRWGRVIALVVVVGVVLLSGYAYAQRHVTRVDVRAGESAVVQIEIPMQRFARRKSYAKERGLPVRVEVIGGDEGDVRFTVIKTWHAVHKMRATVRVEAADSARAGRHAATFDFTIDGEGGWPKARVVARVGG